MSKDDVDLDVSAEAVPRVRSASDTKSEFEFQVVGNWAAESDSEAVSEESVPVADDSLSNST